MSTIFKSISKFFHRSKCQTPQEITFLKKAGCIIVKENDKEVEYKNYKPGVIVNYIIKKESGTFPLLIIDYYLNGRWCHNLYGVVEIPSVHFVHWIPMHFHEVKDELGYWTLLVDLDVNTEFLNIHDDSVIINIIIK